MSQIPDYIDLGQDGYRVMYGIISLVFQSSCYGIYFFLMLISMHALMSRSDSGTHRFLLFAILFSFILSSVYWAYEVARQIVLTQIYFIDRTLRNSQGFTIRYVSLFNAIALLNYVFADAVVVWRARALCNEDYKRSLRVPTLLLCFTILSAVATIGIRIATSLILSLPSEPEILVINICQGSSLVGSILTNLTTTSIIAHKTWHHRKILREGLRNIRSKTTKAEQILIFLLESGAIYCLLLGVTIVLSSSMILHVGTGGDIYSPITVQIAGAYPTTIIVMVALQRAMNDTTFSPSLITVEGNDTPRESEAPGH